MEPVTGAKKLRLIAGDTQTRKGGRYDPSIDRRTGTRCIRQLLLGPENPVVKVSQSLSLRDARIGTGRVPRERRAGKLFFQTPHTTLQILDDLILMLILVLRLRLRCGCRWTALHLWVNGLGRRRMSLRRARSREPGEFVYGGAAGSDRGAVEALQRGSRTLTWATRKFPVTTDFATTTRVTRLGGTATFGWWRRGQRGVALILRHNR
jgi:hypothetical protein